MSYSYREAWQDLKDWLDWKIDNNTVEQPSISNMATRYVLIGVQDIMQDMEEFIADEMLEEGE